MHGMTLRRWAVQLLLICCSLPLRAASDVRPGHALYRAYGPSDGIPGIYILSLLQDREGFLWAGTESGLFRYDGSRFQAFGRRDGLQSSSISRLLEDRDGTLWVGTSVGLHRWTGRTFIANTPVQGLAEEKIWALAQGPKGLWAITSEPDTGPVAHDTSGRFLPVAGWPEGTATALVNEPESDRMWLAVWHNAQAHVIRWQGDRWQRFELPPEQARERVEKLAFDGDGRLWARQPNGLMVKSRDSSFQVAETPLPIRSRSGFLTTGANGDLYVPTAAGLLHHNRGEWSIIDGPTQLPSPWSRTVLEDREGSLWWGSAGLHRRLGRGVWTAYTAREGVPGDVVWSIARDRQQRLWVATNSGIAWLAPEGFRQIRGTKDRDLRTLLQLDDGRLIAGGSIGAELLLVDPETRAVNAVRFGGVDPSVRVMRLLKDRTGTLWAATSDGLHRADARAPTLTFERATEFEGATEGLVGDIREDEQGRLWIAGQRGLTVRDGSFRKTFDATHGLRRSFVSHVLPTAAGEILISYYDPLGVTHATYANGSLHIVRHRDGDNGGTDDVYMLGEDRAQRLWVGGSRGVHLFSGDIQRSFGLDDGLVGEDIANSAFLADDDGQVWIGTSAGLAHFDGRVDEQLTTLPPPPVALLDLHVGSHVVARHDDAPAVPHSENVMQARVAGLSFSAGRRLEYRTQLIGREHEPHVSHSAAVRYSELTPGSYTLEAAARISPEGAWGPASTFSFRIVPAWWQTLAFKLALAVVAVILLRQLLRFRTAMLSRRNRQLETQVSERTMALQTVVTQLRAEVSQRALAEDALALVNREERRRTERFSLIANIASVLSSNLDIDALLHYATQSLREVIGCESVEIPLVDRPGWKRERQDTITDERPAHSLDVAIQLGEELLGAIRIQGAHPFDDLDVKSIEIVADYLAVAIKNARLFSEARDVAIVAERQRVAHDLHDNVTQILAAMRMRAQTLARHSRGQSETITRHTERLSELAQIAVAEMRAFLDQLRPQPERTRPDDQAGEYLHGRSLPEAVQRLLATMVPDNMQTSCDFVGYTAQSVEHEKALFRVCQEAVSNAIRHSGASSV
jgi:ligand-binding sensor domain-containing protein/signal transduction histidine kinase